MKLLKSLAIVSLASLFAFSTAQANTQKPAKKQQTTKQQAKKQPQKKQATKQTQKAPAKKTSTAKKAAVAGAAAAGAGAAAAQQKNALKQFNDAFGIKMAKYQLEKDAAGKTQLHITYEFTNKGKKAVQAVKFIGAFVHHNAQTNKQEIVYHLELPLTFNTPLKAKEQTSIDVTVPFDSLPEASRPYFTDPNMKLGVVNGAQVLVFTDKTGIVIK